MFRYHEGTDFVVKVNDVLPLIPTAAELTEEQKLDSKLVQYHSELLEFLSTGGKILAQNEGV